MSTIWGGYTVDGPGFFQSFYNLEEAVSVARARCKETGNSFYIRVNHKFVASIRMDAKGTVWTDVLEMEGALL